MARRGIPGVSFSLSRALGLSAAKQKLGKAAGVPLTQAGRQRKAGAALGCALVIALPAIGLLCLMLRLTFESI